MGEEREREKGRQGVLRHAAGNVKEKATGSCQATSAASPALFQERKRQRGGRGVRMRSGLSAAERLAVRPKGRDGQGRAVHCNKGKETPAAPTLSTESLSYITEMDKQSTRHTASETAKVRRERKRERRRERERERRKFYLHQRPSSPSASAAAAHPARARTHTHTHTHSLSLSLSLHLYSAYLEPRLDEVERVQQQRRRHARRCACNHMAQRPLVRLPRQCRQGHACQPRHTHTNTHTCGHASTRPRRTAL